MECMPALSFVVDAAGNAYKSECFLAFYMCFPAKICFTRAVHAYKSECYPGIYMYSHCQLGTAQQLGTAISLYILKGPAASKSQPVLFERGEIRFLNLTQVMPLSTYLSDAGKASVNLRIKRRYSHHQQAGLHRLHSLRLLMRGIRPPRPVRLLCRNGRPERLPACTV